MSVYVYFLASKAILVVESDVLNQHILVDERIL